MKFWSKFSFDFTNYDYFHSTDWRALYNFKIKRAHEAKRNWFSFKIFKIMRSLRPSKCLKTTVELAFTTQQANACSPWTARSVFNWKYIFWVNFVQKLKIINLSSNFVPRLIQTYTIPWWCSLFLFSTGNTILGKFGPKKQICQFELKFRPRLIWICRIIRKYVVVIFSVLDQKTPFLDKSGQKNPKIIC